MKHGAMPIQSDAKAGLTELAIELAGYRRRPRHRR